MSKPLLSICIPTYNRCTYLKNSLNSIICQKEFLDGRVEVIISDNASTDDTQSKVMEYASQYKNIRYFKNEENVRDGNFPLSLSRGNGFYRKLSNDSFLYCPGSLGYICGLIQKYKETQKMLFFLDGKGKYLEREIVECTDFDRFVRITNNLATWTGFFGLWESDCEKVLRNISGCELKLWQCKRLYEMAEFKGTVVLTNRRLFYVQEIDGKNMSYGLYQVLHLNFMSILNDYVESGLITQETYEDVCKNNLCFLITFFTRGKQKIKWDFSNRDDVENSIINEAKRIGCWKEYQKRYNKSIILYPLRTYFKITVLNIYCKYLSLRASKKMLVKRIEEKH